MRKKLELKREGGPLPKHAGRRLRCAGDGLLFGDCKRARTLSLFSGDGLQFYLRHCPWLH